MDQDGLPNENKKNPSEKVEQVHNDVPSSRENATGRERGNGETYCRRWKETD